MLITFTIRSVKIPDENIENEAFEYRYLQYDIEKEKFTSGFVTLFDESIGNGEYISYEDETENLVLISDFLDGEYILSGVCSCDGEEKSVKHLLAGRNLESVKRISQAELSKVCSEKFSGSSCKSEIHEIVTKVDSMGGGFPLDDRGFTKYQEFWCKGVCIADPRQIDEVMLEKSKKYPCFHFHRGITLKVFSVEKTLEEMTVEAKGLFAVGTMLEYCKKMGSVLYERWEEEIDGSRELVTTYENMCYDGYHSEDEIPNETIECVVQYQ